MASQSLEKLRSDCNSSFSLEVAPSEEIEDLRAIFISSLNSFSQGWYRPIISQQHEGRVVWGARVVFPTPVGIIRLGPVVFLKECPADVNFGIDQCTGILYSGNQKSFHKPNDSIPEDLSTLHLTGLANQPIRTDPFLIGGFKTNNQRISDKTFFLQNLPPLQTFNLSFEVVRALTKVLCLSAYSQNCLKTSFVLLDDVPVSLTELLQLSNIQTIYDSLIDLGRNPLFIEVPARYFLNQDLAVGLPDSFKLQYAAVIEEGSFTTLIIVSPPSAEPEKLASAIGWLLAAVRENVSSTDMFWNTTNFCILYTTGQGQYSRLMIYSPEYLKNLRTLIE